MGRIKGEEELEGWDGEGTAFGGTISVLPNGRPPSKGIPVWVDGSCPENSKTDVVEDPVGGKIMYGVGEDDAYQNGELEN